MAPDKEMNSRVERVRTKDKEGQRSAPIDRIDSSPSKPFNFLFVPLCLTFQEFNPFRCLPLPNSTTAFHLDALDLEGKFFQVYLEVKHQYIPENICSHCIGLLNASSNVGNQKTANPRISATSGPRKVRSHPAERSSFAGSCRDVANRDPNSNSRISLIVSFNATFVFNSIEKNKLNNIGGDLTNQICYIVLIKSDNCENLNIPHCDDDDDEGDKIIQK